MHSSPSSAHRSPARPHNGARSSELELDRWSNPPSESTPHSVQSPTESLLSNPPHSIQNPLYVPRSTPYLYDDGSASASAMQSPISAGQVSTQRPALMINAKDIAPVASFKDGRSTTPADSPAIGDPQSAQQASRPNPDANSDDNTGKRQAEELPSWAGHKTKAGKERKRLPMACLQCRRRKIKCSGEHPICKHCARSRIPCVYKVTTRKAAPRTDYMAMLDKRLKRMEDRVIKAMPKDEQRNAAATVGRAIVRPINPNATAAKKRQAEQAFADDLANWTKSTAGKEAPKPKHPIPPEDRQSQPNIITDGANHLPSYELQEHLTEVYFEYVYGQAYQLLHKPTYLKRLRAGQLPTVLNLTVCAVAARFSTHPHFGQTTPYLRGEEWAAPAREICMRRYDTPNLTVIMCYLLLGLHEFGTCHGGRSWMLGGMAQRMAYALQLHKNLDPEQYNLKGSEGRKLPQTDRETRLRTMWACFMMDRFNSSGTNRPPFVAEQYIEVRLPIKESLYILEVAGPTEALELTQPPSREARDNMGCSAYTIRAIAIWGDVVRYMNLGGRDSEQCPIWSEQSGYHALSDRVQAFESSLPAGLKLEKVNFDSHVSEGIANQFIFMHIVLQQVSLFLNRFGIPLPGSTISHPKDMPHEFANQCMRRAVIAAHNISDLLLDAWEHRVVAPFAGYSAYFSCTVHIQGMASRHTRVIEGSRQDFGTNIKYLLKLRQYWGMFHYVTEQLKDMVKRQGEARNGQQAQAMEPFALFQYGDWFEKYPNGIAETNGKPAASPPKTVKDSNAETKDPARSDSAAATADRIPAGRVQSTAATAKKEEQQLKRKRVKSVGGRAGDGPGTSQTYSPVGSLNSTQERVEFSPSDQGGPPRLMQHKSFPEVEMSNYATAMPVPDMSAKINRRPTLQQVPPAPIQFMPDMQHTVLDYMSNPTIQTQQPFMPPGSMVQQDPQQQLNLMSELDRQMVMSSYTGMGSVCAPPGHEQGIQSSMDQGVKGLLMSPVDYPGSTAGNVAPNMASDLSSSAWFMPFNHDPRNPVPPNGTGALSMGNAPVNMDVGFDIDALTAFPGFPEDTSLGLNPSAGLGNPV